MATLKTEILFLKALVLSDKIESNHRVWTVGKYKEHLATLNAVLYHPELQSGAKELLKQEQKLLRTMQDDWAGEIREYVYNRA